MAAVLAIGLSACAGPETGSVKESSPSEPDSFPSPAAEPGFADGAEINLELCPEPDVLPTEYTKADELDYRSEFDRPEIPIPGQSLGCSYEIDHESGFYYYSGLPAVDLW
jgi:hypothetical protein